MRRTLAFCFLAAAAASVWATEERITDEDLKKILGVPHDVMRDQWSRIQDLTDGFLTGDPYLIQRKAGEIAQDMREVAKQFPPEPGQEAELWNIMSEVTRQAQLLEGAASKGDYKLAYTHYSALVSGCINCHQLRRSWGKFSEPEPAAQEIAAPKSP